MYDSPNEPLERGKVLIKYGGSIYEPFMVDNDIVFINTTYLKPFDDIEDISFYYKDRHIIIQAGLIFLGMVAPYNIYSDDFNNYINAIAARVDAECKRRKNNTTSYFDD